MTIVSMLMNFTTKRLTISYILVLMMGGVSAQSDIAIGEWKSYLHHNNARYITQSNEKVILGTEQSIYTIDKEDGSMEYLSKVEGLTESGLQDIQYDKFNDQLIIAYGNSIIDIVNGSEVTPIFDIKENTNFVDRRINEIFVQNEEWVYFATGFGVIQYNLKQLEFGFTLNAGRLITDIAGNDNFLVMSSNDGVYFLDYANEFFPNAFSSWQLMSEGLPSSYRPESIAVIDNKIYVADREHIYLSEDNNSFSIIYDIPAENRVRLIKPTADGYMVGLRGNSAGSSVLFFDNQNILLEEVNTCVDRLRDAIVTQDRSIYFADDFEEVRFIDANGNCNKEEYMGPYTSDASDIDIEDDVVYVASGGITEGFANLFGRSGIYILEDNRWNNINESNNELYRDSNLIQHYQIEKHPTKPKLYVGTFWKGLIEMDTETGEQILYDINNTDGALGSPLGDANGGVKISGLTFDKNNNLWISVFGAENPIAVLTDEGTWHNFPITSDRKVSDIIADDVGNIWVVIGGNTGGVMVINPGNSIPDPSDDLPSRFINLNNSEIQTSLVNCIVEDLDGSVWVGTTEGAVVFECGFSAVESACVGNRPKVLEGSDLGFLLETEDIQAIEIDGANRKWFGTRNGIFIQSPNGEEQIARINIDNSPLFDNNIKTMEYNSNTGEMFIASNKGIQSFKTQTTGGERRHSNDVYAYPNPVRPDYQGPIAIKGLARDASVTITDVDGQLVYKTEALGGQAIWDGKNLNGSMAAGGVYLVFSSSTDNFSDPDTYVTKILLVR